MSMSSHLEELRKKHANLSTMVEKAEQSPSTDSLEVVSLKKQKLKIKEEITRLTNA